MMKTLQLVVPCYNEEANIAPFLNAVRQVAATLPDYRVTLLFVDDGSADGTLAEIKRLKADDVEYVSLSRNFGKESAMLAGLRASAGELVGVMDADLQHPPRLLPEMLKRIENGADCCAAQRTFARGRHPLSKWFYHISNRMTEVQMPVGAVDYRVMTRQMTDAVLELAEVERFSKGIFLWVGFHTEWLPYQDEARTQGRSKWSFRGLVRYAVNGILSFSVVPLRVVTTTGALISVGSLIYIVATLIKTLRFGVDVPGYVTTLCAVLFLGGIIELSVGVLGEYLARTYHEVKRRPPYILRESSLPASKPEKRG